MVIGRSTGTRYFFAVMGMIVRDSACSILHPYHEIGIVGSPRCMVLSSCYWWMVCICTVGTNVQTNEEVGIKLVCGVCSLWMATCLIVHTLMEFNQHLLFGMVRGNMCLLKVYKEPVLCRRVSRPSIRSCCTSQSCIGFFREEVRSHWIGAYWFVLFFGFILPTYIPGVWLSSCLFMQLGFPISDGLA